MRACLLHLQHSRQQLRLFRFRRAQLGRDVIFLAFKRRNALCLGGDVTLQRLNIRFGPLQLLFRALKRRFRLRQTLLQQWNVGLHRHKTCSNHVTNIYESRDLQRDQP